MAYNNYPPQFYQPLQPNNNLAFMLMQFKQNPLGMLAQQFNIPMNLNDPNQILQHLLNTKQVSQEQVDGIMQLKNNL